MSNVVLLREWCFDRFRGSEKMAVGFKCSAVTQTGAHLQAIRDSRRHTEGPWRDREIFVLRSNHPE